MNLFIFRVETGTMLEFQLEMTTESVGQLKLEISRILNVPPEDQVLLVSGGICLENSAKVISYSSGTDTNPIFLFSMQSIESSTPPAASPCPKAYIAAQSSAQQKSEVDDVFPDEDAEGIQASGYSSYNEFRKRVLQSRNMPSTMETVTKRARLAQEFYEEALRESQCCHSIVHDQQLAHQGWLAAIANLEDITSDFQKHFSSARIFFEEYLEERDSYAEFLSVYKDVLAKLAKIPIIPSLLLTKFEPSSDGARPPAAAAAENIATKTLLEYIEARRDSNSETTMDSLFETCMRGIEYYHEQVFKNLFEEVQYTFATSNNADMKEIAGLSKRLYGLDELTRSCEPLVKEQKYSAQSFQNNQARAGDLRDNSVLPDLCVSHGKQLVCMLNNHWKLCNIHKRCMRSKEELCSNLHQRLKWVIHTENLLRSSNDRILAYSEHILRLRYNLSVLQQIHMAPEAYTAAVVEVLRRKTFSRAFLLWASELACYMLTIYNEEVTRRKDFNSKYDWHFLMCLFPGMNDLPPNFATQAPPIFDSSLPDISIDDAEELRKSVPELADTLVMPDMSAITHFFLTKSQVKSEDKSEGTCEEKLVQVVNEVGLGSNLDQNLLKPGGREICLVPQEITQLKDLDRGCESETDTEEFEKVCQSPMDLQFEKDPPVSPRQVATTLTEVCVKNTQLPSRMLSHTECFASIKQTSLDSLQRLEGEGAATVLERSKSLPPRCGGAELLVSPMHAYQTSDFVNDEFYIDESLPSSISIDAQAEIALQLSNANDVVALLQDNLQTSKSEHDKLKDLLVHTAALCRSIFAELRQEMTEIKTKVHCEGSALELRCKSLTSSWDSLTNKFDLKEKELFYLTESHQQELLHCREQLKLRSEEIKCLREENSCLDSSLNKLVAENKQLLQMATDVDYKSHIAMIQLQLDEKVLNERELKETIDRMACEHKTAIDDLRKKFRFMTDRSPSECMEPDSKRKLAITEEERNKIVQEVRAAESLRTEMRMAEKNKEYDFELKKLRDDAKRTLDERDKLIAALNLDCMKHKTLLLQLTESQMENSSCELRQQVEILQKEKDELETQLTSERLKRMESSEMTASTSSCSGAKKSKYKEALTISQTSLVTMNRVSVDSCNKGDSVLVMWKPKYKNFLVLQESDVLHFVHSDCTRDYKHLSLRDDTSIYFPAQVVEKEYCQTKKSQNRYNVEKGTKFYRVKIVPIYSLDDEHSTTIQMSQSNIVPIEDAVDDTTCHSLPNTPTMAGSQ